MSENPEGVCISIGKLDAARRQLETAIKLWFQDGDPVCIHALSYAAYEIIHTISKKRNPNRVALLFDASFIKEERRSEFNIRLKEHANFFKHGNKDGDAVIDFYPSLSMLFMFVSIAGLETCGERLGDEELAFHAWLQIHRPDFFYADEDGKRLPDRLPVHALEQIRNIKKSEFLESYIEARQLQRR